MRHTAYGATLALLLLLGGACAPGASPSQRATEAAPPASAQSTAVGAAPTAPPAPVRVRVGSQFASTDIGHYIAIERGYFREEGLDVTLESFANASEMVPALATDQIEVGGVGGNAATWNAIARGVLLKLVLDKGSVRPGMGYTALVIRKEVYDAGRGHRLDDLKGLRIAFTPPGKATTNAMPMDVAMQRAGASIDDLVIEPLPFPDMVPALANGSVDGAMIVEPFLTHALRQGSVVRVMGLDEMYPNYNIALVGFSRAFYAQRDAAKRFAGLHPRSPGLQRGGDGAQRGGRPRADRRDHGAVHADRPGDSAPDGAGRAQPQRAVRRGVGAPFLSLVPRAGLRAGADPRRRTGRPVRDRAGGRGPERAGARARIRNPLSRASAPVPQPK